MKNVKLFIGITTIFALMMMLVGCDVFDGSGKWNMGDPRFDSGVGKYYNAFDNTPDVNDIVEKEPPDQNVLLPLLNPPVSQFVFFVGEFGPLYPAPTGDIYVVIPNIMEPKLSSGSVLYAIIDGSEAAREIAEYNGRNLDSTNDFNVAGADENMHTVRMEYSTTHPVDGAQNAKDKDGNDANGYYYIKINATMTARGKWFTSGIRMDFTTNYDFRTWNAGRFCDGRLSFVDEPAKGAGPGANGKFFAMMPLTLDDFNNDPFLGKDNGDYVNILLNFNNSKKFFKPDSKTDGS